MDFSDPSASHTGLARRTLLKYFALSPLAMGANLHFGGGPIQDEPIREVDQAKNVFDLERVACNKLEPIACKYLNGGADDLKTLQANRSAFDEIQIRARRLIDVSRIDTQIQVLGQTMATPILLAPVGFLNMFDPRGELTTAQAAQRKQTQMIASTLSSFPVGEIAHSLGQAPWFQLYTTPQRDITHGLLALAERAGCRVLALTVDTPAIGNREDHAGYLTSRIASGELVAGNLVELGVQIESLPDPSLDWDFVKWLRERWPGKLALKGIVTAEDSQLAGQRGVDAVMVSNHGGRQLESLRSTIECLPEVVQAADGRMSVLIDSGFRRGTDIFKALALGADAICIGRPFVWGLAAFGQSGVEKVLDLLRAELILDMQLAGTPAIDRITPEFVKPR